MTTSNMTNQIRWDILTDNSNSHDITITPHRPLKKPWLVGPTTLMVIDKSLVDKLGIDENTTLLQQDIADGGYSSVYEDHIAKF